MTTMPSDFRIYPHVHRGSANQDLARWHAEGSAPAWVKVLDPVNCSEVYAASPETHALLRLVDMSMNGAYLTSRESGRQFVRDALARCGGSFASARVYALEFMNERTDFENVPLLQACNESALGFVEECVRSGVRPVVHNNSFACPRPDLMRYLLPSIAAALAAGGYYGQHSYGPRDLFAGGDYFALCWRQQLDALERAGLHVPPERVLITEFGHDYVKQFGAQSGAWRALGLTVEQVTNEYTRYDVLLRAAGIAGAFLFDWWTFGPSDFECVPFLMPWYNQMLAYHKVTAPAPPPATVPAPAFPYQARVTAAPHLHIRSAPEVTPTSEIGSATTGARVTVTEHNGEWAHVTTTAEQPGGAVVAVRGWCVADWLERVA